MMTSFCELVGHSVQMTLSRDVMFKQKLLPSCCFTRNDFLYRSSSFPHCHGTNIAIKRSQEPTKYEQKVVKLLCAYLRIHTKNPDDISDGVAFHNCLLRFPNCSKVGLLDSYLRGDSHKTVNLEFTGHLGLCMLITFYMVKSILNFGTTPIIMQ